MIRWFRDIILQPILGVAGLLVTLYYSTLGKKFVVKKYWDYSEKFKVNFFVIITDHHVDDWRSGICLLRVIVIEKPNVILINGQFFNLDQNQVEKYNSEELDHEVFHYPQEIAFPWVLFPVIYGYSQLIGWIYKINYRDRWFEK